MTFAVLCPGQGAQHPALLDFVDRFPESQEIVEVAAETLGEDPRAWTRGGDAIYRNAIAQPLIVIAQVAQWAALRSGLPAPLALAGYSVGELACHGVAGALDIGELARLARTRAEAMDAAAAEHQGGLLGVNGLARSTLQRLCAATRAYIAIAIADDTYVVGGDETALQGLRDRSQRAGAKVTELRVGIASHTPLLAAAAETFRDALDRSAWSAPSIPVIAGVDASLITSRARAIETMSAQISHTVEWAHCLDALYERGCRVYLELGPGSALSKMVRARFDDVEARAVDEFRRLENASGWVQQRVRAA
jgi:[acyl-carrier-protein] S-malonyltransferase